jgi:hypothetical protein
MRCERQLLAASGNGFGLFAGFAGLLPALKTRRPRALVAPGPNPDRSYSPPAMRGSPRDNQSAALERCRAGFVTLLRPDRGSQPTRSRHGAAILRSSAASTRPWSRACSRRWHRCGTRSARSTGGRVRRRDPGPSAVYPSMKRPWSGPRSRVECREMPGSSTRRCVSGSPARRRSSCSFAIGFQRSSTTVVASPST